MSGFADVATNGDNNRTDLTREFFHVCANDYMRGDIKHAGVFGSLFPNDPAMIDEASDPLGEYLRERLRREHYSDKPSRFASTFVWETWDDAVWFRDNFRVGAAIFRVRFIDTMARAHRVCHTAFRMPSSEMDPPAVFLAHEFWARPLIYDRGTELFAESDIEIVAKIL